MASRKRDECAVCGVADPVMTDYGERRVCHRCAANLAMRAVTDFYDQREEGKLRVEDFAGFRRSALADLQDRDGTRHFEGISDYKLGKPMRKAMKRLGVPAADFWGGGIAAREHEEDGDG